MNLVSVTCPSCFEQFEVVAPFPGEMPASVDYDCEVCCRPMTIQFEEDEDGEVDAQASGLGW